MIDQILKALHCDNVPRITEGQEDESKRLATAPIVGPETGNEWREMDALSAERDSRFTVCPFCLDYLQSPANFCWCTCPF